MALVVELRFVAGAHEYVEPPLAVIVVLLPVQMEGADGFTVTVMEEFTVTVTVAVAVQPAALVPVTVYVVVTVGDALIVAPVVALRPVAGDHE